MYLWTQTAMDVMREASNKAENLNHLEVEPLHLFWAATFQTGINLLHQGEDDVQQAKLMYQLERDLSKLAVPDDGDPARRGIDPVPGLALQQVLLRAADYARKRAHRSEDGCVGLTELIQALRFEDHRAACLVRHNQRPAKRRLRLQKVD